METRYQRVAREQRERQAARAKRQAAIGYPPDHGSRHKAKQKAAERLKDSPYWDEDRTPFGQGDNLGESPDY